MDRGQQILVLSKAIDATFNSSDWTEVGYLTGTDKNIDQHPRLLRSLRFGDDDYKACVMEMVAYILDNEQNIKRLVEFEKIATWLKANDAGGMQALQAEIYGSTVPEVLPLSSETAQLALSDAQALLESRGPTSAVDRVHTGLHGFLKSACNDMWIPFPSDATANQLLKLLLEHHPALQDLGPRLQEVRKIIRSSASMVDALGTLRNHASLAHPNEELLDRDEALLAINLARSLISFLAAKLGNG